MSKPNCTNFLNAQHSTGPRTEVGKKRSSLNALRHGLTSQVVVLPTEDLAAYVTFIAEFQNDLKPAGVIEKQLVQTLADTQWRLNRCAALESNLYSVELADAAAIAAQAHAEKDRLKRNLSEACNIAHVETPQLPDPDPDLTLALNTARAFQKNESAIRTLGIHEQRLQRIFHQTFKLLQTLQAQRRSEDQSHLQRAALLQQANQAKGLPYNPAEDGFVCSNAEIDLYIACQARVKEAHAVAAFGFDPKKIAAADLVSV